MTWLLERGASLTLVNSMSFTIAHLLASRAGAALTTSATAEFCCRWLRRTIAANPSLREARVSEGFTPLIRAAEAGFDICVAALLELGADVGAAGPAGHTALTYACIATSLPVMRQLIAAGAASAAPLPPGSPQAGLVAHAAMRAALVSERGCGECARRCGGRSPGNCADGLEILRAVLAAGMREAENHKDRSLAALPVAWMHHEAKRVSAEHALTVLQALHAAGVNVLWRARRDPTPILHAATMADASSIVRWLVSVVGSPANEMNADGYTPLTMACYRPAWASAHALLDCGARVDLQSAAESGEWPVLLAAEKSDAACTVLRRLLAADRDSLLRCATGGFSALHMAAHLNPKVDALQLLLGSGLPHLSEAMNAVAVPPSSRGWTPSGAVTPLHCACNRANWAAALALLAAGARVDIAGAIDGRAQTVAAWADGSTSCKHRGLKLAVAVRAREHAAHAAAAAKGLPSGGARSVAREASTSAPAVEAAVTAATAAAGPGVGKGKQLKGRKRRHGAASNRAELPSNDEAPVLLAPCAAAAAPASSFLCAIDGGTRVPASAALAAAAASVALSTCEGPTAAATAGASTLSLHAPETSAPAASYLNHPEDPFLQPTDGMSAPVNALGPLVPAASTNTCKPGAESGSGVNTCEPGAEAGSGVNTCEPSDAAATTEAVAAGGASAGRRVRLSRCEGSDATDMAAPVGLRRAGTPTAHTNTV
jgi:ankyrin repeat protein